MKITIECTPKEMTDLMSQAQDRSARDIIVKPFEISEQTRQSVSRELARAKSEVNRLSEEIKKEQL